MSTLKILNNKKYSISQKTLFFVDSLGGLVSAIMLGFVLVRFESLIGVPPKTLFFLSGIACLLFLYSFFCYLREIKYWRVYMKILAILNTTYCCLTIGLIIFLFQEVTILGLIYFVVEVIVVFILAIIEWKAASSII